MQINNTFKNTLGLLPNGVVIIDLKTQQISYANSEMIWMLGSPNGQDYEEVKRTLKKFKLNEKIDRSSKIGSGVEMQDEKKSLENSGSFGEIKSLWSFLIKS